VNYNSVNDLKGINHNYKKSRWQRMVCTRYSTQRSMGRGLIRPRSQQSWGWNPFNVSLGTKILIIKSTKGQNFQSSLVLEGWGSHGLEERISSTSMGQREQAKGRVLKSSRSCFWLSSSCVIFLGKWKRGMRNLGRWWKGEKGLDVWGVLKNKSN